MSTPLKWHETYFIGRRVGGALIIGGLLLASYILVKSPRSRISALGSIGSIFGGLYLYNKSYLKDPIYRSKVLDEFRKKSLRESIGAYGWNEIREVVSLDELQVKVIDEMGDNPTLRSIWSLYDHDIVCQCLQYGVLSRDLLHRLCLEEIDIIGFEAMYKNYKTWWLDEGVVETEEISVHFMLFYNSVTDIIYFFENYMSWPVLRYKDALGFYRNHPGEFKVISQMYETYSLAKKSYTECERQIKIEYQNVKEAHDTEYALAYQRYQERKISLELLNDPKNGKNSEKLRRKTKKKLHPTGS